MNTESRRKAAITYKAKLAAMGYRQKAFRFAPETLADLERLSKEVKLTEAQYIAKLIGEAAAAKADKLEPKPTPVRAKQAASKREVKQKLDPVTDPETGVRLTRVQVGPVEAAPGSRLKKR